MNNTSLSYSCKRLVEFSFCHCIYLFLGCSKCLKQFPRILTVQGKSKGDFSGFSRIDWPPRDPIRHCTVAAEVKNAVTEREAKAAAMKYGARWSSLFELPYYNAVTDHAVDPMHCLFLGIAKKMTKHYLNSGLLSKSDLLTIQSRVDSIKVPSNTGRIPRKISSGYSSFTADQWKNWTLIYSTVALRGVLPEADYSIWQIFVRAVFLLTRKIISRQNLATADALLEKFCLQVENHYGKAFCVPNLHMCLHIKECVEAFGPIYAFWCYSFER